MLKKNIIVMIPARIGSKGIPQKVLRPFNGSPLIFRIIEVALSLEKAIVYLNTDSSQIANAVKEKYDKRIEIYFRSEYLGDDTTTLDALALDFVEANNFQNETLITLQPTSPLLSKETLAELVEEYQKDKTESLLTVTETRKLEWAKTSDGHYIKKYKERVNRQFIEPSYIETGAVVICNTQHLLKNKTRFSDEAHCFEISKNQSIDIDTPSDWILAEALDRGRKIAFMTFANQQIGSGHLQRTLSIANFFPDYFIEFILYDTSEEWINLVKKTNYKFHKVRNVDDAFKTAAILDINLLVLDILNTNQPTLNNLKAQKNNLKIVSFEDLGDGSILTDATINELYPSVSDQYNIYNGPKYAFFRHEFLDLSKLDWTNREYDLVISFGGTDPNNLTMRVLNIIENIQEKINIRVVLGIGAKRLEKELKEYINKSHHNIDASELIGNISEEWMNSKYGICGGGRTVYEFMVCDVATIVLCQNSRELTHLYSSKVNGVNNIGVHSEVDDVEIFNVIESLDFQADSNPFPVIKYDPRDTNNRVIKLIRNQLEL